jgi:hypothetical protein
MLQHCTDTLNVLLLARSAAAAAADVFDQHLLSTLQVRTLQGVTDTALDVAGEALLDWRLLQPACKLRGLPKLMQTVQVSRCSNGVFRTLRLEPSCEGLQIILVCWRCGLSFVRHKHCSARRGWRGLLDWQLLQAACRLRGLPKLMQTVQVSQFSSCWLLCCLEGLLHTQLSSMQELCRSCIVGRESEMVQTMQCWMRQIQHVL